ncbi:argininosuccinate lyase [Alicyclobacillus macrosporangiidus]|uniref:Argininosuccinate lyase n=1 Tax=Alicyclobacillus macrosporangiidus TaxID=392015 RepID=A0A1I7GSM5_9BACL|nr:argininosuccinate lyase [Alicyclobacillus macrosporangiidus]SFU51391.1 argininosuccinate lyase [Alicyclobacillus macrosporangiidus]
MTKSDIFAREGRTFPGRTYAEVVLAPAYEQAKVHLLTPMLQIHQAHLVMLAEQGLVSRADAGVVMRAIRSLNLDELAASRYDGSCEDLFFSVERKIIQAAGEVGGSLHLARSRNDLGVAMYRLALRERLQRAIGSALSFLGTVLDLAEEHADTVMLGYTHTQQAQPMTLAHYLIAVHDSVARDVTRLRAAYRTCNRSPLGAAALTTTGFPIDRRRVADLLGFDGVVENAYDAIGGGDYLAEAATAVQVAFLGIGRYVQDLLWWATEEFGAIRVADPYVQTSSIMPQKRNPVSLEHIRALSSSGFGSASTVLQMMHNTPFGDINDTEDDLQPYLWRSVDLADQVFRLFAAVLGTLEVNRDLLLRRARESFATVTELADTLVRAAGLPFRTAHAVTAAVVQRALARGIPVSAIDGALVDEAAQAVIGRPLGLPADVIAEALDPVHFVSIRRLPGGPAPEEARRALAERRRQLAAARTAVDAEASRVQAALAELERLAAALAGE